MKPPYEITNRILMLYGEISEALGVYHGLLLNKPEARLRKENRIWTIHSSLAIEGNTLNIENVTALLENNKVIGPKKDILEVENAIKAYNELANFNVYDIDDFLKAHSLLMDKLILKSGEFRKSQVGIMKGKELTHIAPSSEMVLGLMKDLFSYLKDDSDLDLIKSCVFHYEMEFIHPFEDGNGRMGRYWQTKILMNINPIFEFVPIEKLIKENQEDYYKVLSICDRTGKSTVFIEFMLDIINETFRETIQLATPKSKKNEIPDRINFALSKLDSWFDRKKYMGVCQGISTATASRDLKTMLQKKLVESRGEGRSKKYKKTR